MVWHEFLTAAAAECCGFVVLPIVIVIALAFADPMRGDE